MELGPETKIARDLASECKRVRDVSLCIQRVAGVLKDLSAVLAYGRVSLVLGFTRCGSRGWGREVMANARGS
jgi:hypothetical protein